MQPV